jgi:peptide/nickel transport system substrate-binding protein
MPGITRLYHLHVALVALLLTVLLASCGGTPAAPAAPTEAPAAPAATEAPAAAEPVEAGPNETLVYALDATDLLTLDPALAYEFSGIQVVGNMYETLVSFDPGSAELKGVLATEWNVEDTGDTWTLTFSLNPEATFASGNPVTAEDVVYSWGRAIDLAGPPSFLLIDEIGMTKENLTAVDPQTVELKIAKEKSPQIALSILTFSIAAVIEQAAVEANLGSDNGTTFLNDASAGSGPYVLESWERNAQITMGANPAYWGSAPAIKRVIFRNEPELANLQSAVETGDADIVQGLGPEQLAVLEGNPDITIDNPATTILVYVGMNAKKAPLDKVEVRQAIRYAINYDEIITLLGGNGELVQEIIPKGLFGHVGENPFSQDLERSRELLAQAGVAEGTEIEFLVPTGPAPGGVEWGVLAAKIQSDLAQVGLTINIQQIQQSELLNIYRAQGAQMVLINWGPDYPDPAGNVTPFTSYAAKSIAWRNDWDNPEIAELSAQASVELDSQRRAELYAQITERVLNEGPYVILYQPTRAFGIRSNISGFAYDPADTPPVSFWLIQKN